MDAGAGVVDEDVDPPEGVERPGQQPLDVGGDGDVAADEVRLDAGGGEGAQLLVRRLLVASAEDDGGARLPRARAKPAPRPRVPR